MHSNDDVEAIADLHSWEVVITITDPTAALMECAKHGVPQLVIVDRVCETHTHVIVPPGSYAALYCWANEPDTTLDIAVMLAE